MSDKEKITEEFANDVLLGLGSTPKTLNSKYIYDDEGSRLFEQIMGLEEYYLTQCEFEILKAQTPAFVQPLTDGGPFNLVELGAGNGEKTAILLQYLLEKNFDFKYYPIDISGAAIEGIKKKFHLELPSLNMEGIATDYFEGLKWLKHNTNRRNMVLFMGANIGNLTPPQLKEFLYGLWNSLHIGDLVVIGFDLVKDYYTISRAYNDPQGVTRRFQMNLLGRINRELGGSFNLDAFDYYTTFNPFTSSIESFLVSLKDQPVDIKVLDRRFHFYAYEPIHTEYSFKYRIPDIEAYASEAGFRVVNHLYDSKKYFVDSVWEVEKAQH